MEDVRQRDHVRKTVCETMWSGNGFASGRGGMLEAGRGGWEGMAGAETFS